MIPETWTPIAYEKGGLWVMYPTAPFTLDEAKILHQEGQLLMAQRRCMPTSERPIMHMQIVIKARQNGGKK